MECRAMSFPGFLSFLFRQCVLSFLFRQCVQQLHFAVRSVIYRQEGKRCAQTQVAEEPPPLSRHPNARLSCPRKLTGTRPSCARCRPPPWPSSRWGPLLRLPPFLSRCQGKPTRPGIPRPPVARSMLALSSFVPFSRRQPGGATPHLQCSPHIPYSPDPTAAAQPPPPETPDRSGCCSATRCFGPPPRTPSRTPGWRRGAPPARRRSRRALWGRAAGARVRGHIWDGAGRQG